MDLHTEKLPGKFSFIPHYNFIFYDMPTNKHALIRYRVINRCLKDFTYTSKERLVEACSDALSYNVSPRTILQDIKDMKEDDHLEFKAPIVLEKGKGYFYEDPDYSIDNIPLNADEVTALAFASTMLDQFRNVQIFSKSSAAVQKIVDIMNVRRIAEEENLFPFVEFEQTVSAGGSEYLETIIKAIRDQQVIRLKYKKFGEEKGAIHLMHPYLVRQYRSRWYVIGLKHDTAMEIRTFSLDRIVEMPEVTDLEYVDIGFNTREHYKSVIGIVSPGPDEEPVDVVLKFSKAQAWYVITQPIHPSQKVTWNEDHVIVELHIIPTYELTMLIMSWAYEVEVLQPQNLRKLIKKRHLDTAKSYLYRQG